MIWLNTHRDVRKFGDAGGGRRVRRRRSEFSRIVSRPRRQLVFVCVLFVSLVPIDFLEVCCPVLVDAVPTKTAARSDPGAV